MSKTPAPKPTPAPVPQPVSSSTPAAAPKPVPVPVPRAAAVPAPAPAPKAAPAPKLETREIRVAALDLDQKAHDRRDIDLLYRIYVSKRISEQVKFYQSRIKENERNADFTFATGALVMTLSSLVATVSVSIRDPFWTPFLTVLSAILPAMAALLASFRQLYSWERQATVYRETLLGLERVKLLAPDNDRVAAANLLEVYPQLVTSSETVFTAEVSQWGQFLAADGKEVEPSKGDTALRGLFDSLQLTDEQRATVEAIIGAGNKTQAVKETHVVVQTELPPAEAAAVGSQTVVTEISTTTEAGMSASSSTSVNVNGVDIPATSNVAEMATVNGESEIADSESAPVNGLEGTYGMSKSEGEADPKAEGGVG